MAYKVLGTLIISNFLWLLVYSKRDLKLYLQNHSMKRDMEMMLLGSDLSDYVRLTGAKKFTVGENVKNTLELSFQFESTLDNSKFEGPMKKGGRTINDAAVQYAYFGIACLDLVLPDYIA
ncbi:hypothetical protein TNIN_258771 [Trichonephila inaurata madagascariensis]|uniref:Uncharacterized protein n=1 Tax=Trichonephila inaurata madagascariensis TaxID=2747483 RepID=A0A8X6IZT6_9ARAC|nr:hypothetical protein TNIN_258771 [Trichonephila inaurata madagascariensis]